MATSSKPPFAALVTGFKSLRPIYLAERHALEFVASRVLSTYWPTLDDGGALTSEFYRQLTTNRFSTAEALRRAQLAMIAHGDWRADPRYWAAYFLIGYPDLP